jgi:18S rRNA (adenine1779-N6/adenine1780-N6)-dimethyltransferase
VVRIELRNPPPPVNFVEWDGLIRLLFNRKHKTLRAILCAKSTLAVLEENMKTHMSVSSAGTSTALQLASPDIKSLVEQVLIDTNFSEARAAKMDINDFLALLSAFNGRGIHFT